METTDEQPYYDMAPSKMPSPSRATTYDPRRLSLAQGKMIAALLGHQREREAAKEAGISITTHRKWLQVDANYRSAVRELGVELLDSARASLDMLLPAAAEAYADGVGATESLKIDAVCPECGHQFLVYEVVPDLKTRLATADRLFKRSGDMAAQVKVSGEIQHRDMALEDRLALAQVSAWMAPGGGREAGEPCPVPPDVFRSLQLRGLLTDEGTQGGLGTGAQGRNVLTPAQAAGYGHTPDSDSQAGEYRLLPAPPSE